MIPGKITLEMPANDRVVGGTTETATLMAEALYSNFVTGSIRCSNATTAEMVKLTENAFRDVNIAFANELSLISAELSVDVWELIELANHHPRVNILSPGPGVGGHCIAVDPWFLAASASSAPLIHAARAVNDSKPTFVVEEIQKAIDSNESKALSVFGLAFKADVGDLRESPSLEIVRNVAERNPAVSVMVVEPYVTCLPPALKDLANVTLVSVEKALDESTLAVMLVGHKQFLTVDQDLFASAQLLDFTGKWSS